MDLSTAIREGATIRRQGFGAVRLPEENTSCVLEAAYEALTGHYAPVGESLVGTGTMLTVLRERFPEMAILPADCHLCEWRGTDPKRPGPILWHLNDSHRWTREQIADWIAAR